MANVKVVSKRCQWPIRPQSGVFTMKLDFLDKVIAYVIAAAIVWQAIAFVFDWMRTALGIPP